MFTEWLVEAHYLRTFLKLSFRIPHFTTLQKFADRITGTILERILSSFILLTTVKQIFFGIDSSGFKPTYASQYYTERSGLGKKWIKLSVGADMLKQVICTIKIRRAPPARHDNVDFQPIITRTSEIKPLSVAVADKGYDSEENHVLVREDLKAYSIIPTRYRCLPIWRTHGRYRKQMKRGYSQILYNQRNKDETIMSVIKRLFGEHVISRLVRTQNRELSFRCIAYNMHRITNLLSLVMMISTKPINSIDLYIIQQELTML
jgi:Transposase DDE domain